MELIRDIIDILSSETPNLENALIKTKILFHAMGNKEAMDWVNKELQGYGDENDVPPYRTLNSEPIGTVTNGYYFYNNHVLPVKHLDKDVQNKLIEKHMTHAIAEIETMIDGKGDSLVINIPPEFLPHFSDAFLDGYYVQSAVCRISVHQLKRITTNLRSRLLDFVLELSDRIPKDSVPDDLANQGQKLGVESLFRETVIGDNATIIVGNHNIAKPINIVAQGDLQGLMDHIESLGVDGGDRQELKGVLASQISEEEKSAAADGWAKRIAAKLAETTLQIEIGTIVVLLTQAVNQYLGL